MARLIVRAGLQVLPPLLLLLLCAWLSAFQAARAQTTDFSLPPEDLDSSGDDDDSFSGSGAGSVNTWGVPVQESINMSSSPSVAADVDYHEPEAQGTERPSEEDYQRVPVSPTNVHVFLVHDLATDEPVESIQGEELDVFPEQATTSSAVVTARVPVTQHTFTLSTTSSHASSTVGVLEPVVYHNVHHDISGGDTGTPADDIGPPVDHPDATSSATTSLVLVKDPSARPEEEVLPPEDGSGDLGDFIFSVPDEKTELETEKRAEGDLGVEGRAFVPGSPDAKSQGLMDRKDVLAGVIAGGLVGLLFAGFLVGFMLYRMKKKDEGSYSLDEPKQSNGGYQKPHKQEEFYA